MEDLLAFLMPFGSLQAQNAQPSTTMVQSCGNRSLNPGHSGCFPKSGNAQSGRATAVHGKEESGICHYFLPSYLHFCRPRCVPILERKCSSSVTLYRAGPWKHLAPNSPVPSVGRGTTEHRARWTEWTMPEADTMARMLIIPYRARIIVITSSIRGGFQRSPPLNFRTLAPFQHFQFSPAKSLLQNFHLGGKIDE